VAYSLVPPRIATAFTACQVCLIDNFASSTMETGSEIKIYSGKEENFCFASPCSH
jgi:hypothetical protein